MAEFGHPRVLPDDEVGSAVSVGIAEVGSPERVVTLRKFI